MDAAPTNESAVSSPELLDELERRVRSLEEAVARLDDTPALEERIVARLAERLPQAKAAPGADTNIIEDRVHQRASAKASAMPPTDAGAKSAAADDWDVPPLTAWGGGWASWLFVDMLREGRFLVRMIFDPRYAMAWTTRLVVIVVLPLILTSHWWLTILLCGFPWVEGLRGILVAAANLVLAFALYKAFSREVRRYQDHLRGPAR